MPERKPTRLPHYDYSQPGYYFVTICSNDTSPVFGTIQNQKIQLTPIGKIVEESINNTLNRLDNIDLDYLQMMPDHIHLIIVIIENEIQLSALNVNTIENSRGKMLLSKVIQAFKSVSTREVKKMQNRDFKWQKSYYDHVIRNEGSLNKIRQYIVNNPMKLEIEQGFADAGSRNARVQSLRKEFCD